MPKRHAAFTLIEVLVVSMIIAILSISLAVSFSGSRENAQYNAARDNVFNFFQKARGLSFNSIYVNGNEELNYYLLFLSEDEITLTAVGDTEEEEIDSLQLENMTFDLERYYTAKEIQLYYFPPYGTFCVQDSLSGCSSTPDWSDGDLGEAVYIPLISTDEEESYEVTFGVSTHGGFIEILDSSE